ncbi:UNVERIFIED_CONTAM: hypothetical protein ABID98_000362 [Brevibacillus sp. OAP136]
MRKLLQKLGSMAKTVGYRVYSDFLMPSRLATFENLLNQAIECDYEVHSVASFWEVIKSGGPVSGKRYLILRHDVDTDIATAREMWTIEQRLGVRASFYFRLSTIDIPLMRQIHEEGGEASYHYEEIATIGKEKALSTEQQIVRELPLMRHSFAQTLFRLRKLTGLPMHTVASHGDFFNRKLGIANHELLAESKLRKETAVELETYDDAMMKYVTSRHSDTLAPAFWKPNDPFEAISRKEAVIYLLTHPRHWRTDPYGNLLDNSKRLWEGVLYAMRKNGKFSMVPGSILSHLSVLTVEGEWANAMVSLVVA